MKKVFYIISVSWIICWAFAAMVNSYVHKIESGEYGKLNYLLKNQHELDVLFLGTSRAAFHFDVNLLKNDGIKMYNGGLAGANSQIILGVFKTLLAKNCKPKVLVLNVDFFQWQSKPFNTIQHSQRFLPYLGEANLFESLVTVDPKFWLYKYLVPYAVVQYGDWHYQNLWRADHLISDSGLCGFEARGETNADFFNKSEHWESVASNIQYEGVKQIFELCRLNNIALIPVVTPVFRESQAFFMKDQKSWKQLNALCSQYGFKLINCYDMPWGNDKAFFTDEIHLNETGAKAFSLHFKPELRRVLDSVLVQ